MCLIRWFYCSNNQYANPMAYHQEVTPESHDGKYMLKTIHYREYKYFRSILEDYYMHIKNNPDTMMTKFYGLHKILQKDREGNLVSKKYFVIMANIFNTKEQIQERYDLKGSWFGRETHNPNPNATKKDNDFKKRDPIELKYEDREKIMNVIRRDVEFFRSHELIDYSLLVGVIAKRPLNMSETVKLKPDHDSTIYQGTKESYIFGIIDFLTEYGTRKAMQFCFKRVIYGEGISAVPPDDYAERFVNFMDKVVLKRSDKKPLMEVSS